jgi:hypothetical protein
MLLLCLLADVYGWMPQNEDARRSSTVCARRNKRLLSAQASCIRRLATGVQSSNQQFNQKDKEQTMKVLANPVSQRKILESVRKNSDPSRIHAAIVAKAECCVDHLCGCKK